MALTAESSAYYLSQYENLQDSLPGNDLTWLRERRQAALSVFSESGFPSPREEEWRYTNVAPIERKLFSPGPVEEAKVDPGVLKSVVLQDAAVLVFVDGCYNADLSSLSGLPEGVVVSSMAEALIQHPDYIAELLGTATHNENNGFISFNTAFFSAGAYIFVPADQVVERPVQLVFVATQDDQLYSTRNLIKVDAGAQISIVETYIGMDQIGYLSASVSEVFVGENANVRWNKLQCESNRAFHFGGVYSKPERYGRFDHSSYSFGGLLVRNEVHVDLDDASECKLDGLFLASKRQHVDNHTRVNHLKPHGISREMYKGILDQRARGVFQGRVVVAENAQKTDSAMSNRNLLLSPDAEIDTKPQLEIYADDVKCAHGVTVGQLDEDAIFFLQARGIDRATARNMLTFAFANEMVERIEIPCVRSMVQGQLLERFPQANIRKEWL